MNYIDENDSQVDVSYERSQQQPFSYQDQQSHLMALASELGHSVFELNNTRNGSPHERQSYSDSSYRKSKCSDGQLALGKCNVDSVYYEKPIDCRRQDAEKMSSSKIVVPEVENTGSIQETRNEQIHENETLESKYDEEIIPKKEIDNENLEEEILENCKRSLRIKQGQLMEEDIISKRAAQAAAQREVRRRRRQKMTDEELQEHLATVAASQRESRKRQLARLSEEELLARRAMYAQAQREIRKRKLGKMSEEELKTFRAREAARKRELRQLNRMKLTEEELKELKKKEAAESAFRRARRIAKKKLSAVSSSHESDFSEDLSLDQKPILLDQHSHSLSDHHPPSPDLTPNLMVQKPAASYEQQQSLSPTGQHPTHSPDQESQHFYKKSHVSREQQSHMSARNQMKGHQSCILSDNKPFSIISKSLVPSNSKTHLLTDQQQMISTHQSRTLPDQQACMLVNQQPRLLATPSPSVEIHECQQILQNQHQRLLPEQHAHLIPNLHSSILQSPLPHPQEQQRVPALSTHPQILMNHHQSLISNEHSHHVANHISHSTTNHQSHLLGIPQSCSVRHQRLDLLPS